MTPEPARAAEPRIQDPGPFPDAQRVIYEHNTLAEVICQLRFPTVLRIEAEVPASFQDRIRNTFEIYKEPPVIGGFGGVQIPEQILQLVRNTVPALARPPRAFSSADENWTVTLAKDFVSLQTKQYTRWEDFRRHLEPALEALEADYSPSFYSRIGLRYRNVIRRSAVGLDGVGWGELLRRELAGELTAADIAGHVEAAVAQTIITLNAASKVQIIHGLSEEDGELCYVIDNDLYTEERTERADVIPTLQFFCAQAHRLFRWCIADRLHTAMGPRPLA